MFAATEFLSEKGIEKMKKIAVSDITLKKLSQDRQVALLFREKTAIAVCADSIGANIIELAPIKNPREDSIVYKTISQKIKNATVSIPVGFDKDSVLAAWECIKEANSPRLQIELPVSTVLMEYTYHIKAEKMLAKIAELTSFAKTLCENVEFSALDATRADSDFIIAAAKEAIANGATAINLCDDAGDKLPEEIAELVKTLKSEIDVPVYVQLSDRVNMAVAASVAAIKAGADGIKCAMSGNGTLLTGEFADAMSICSKQIGAETSLNNTKIHASIEDMLTKISHDEYINDTLSEKQNILLDSDSTIAQVAVAARILGYELTDSDCGNVHKALMQVCEKKDAVGATELEAVIASSAMQAPSTYHLESYTTSSSNLASSMSQVTLSCNGEIINGVSIGDGPIDSAFRAIEQCIGYHYELDDFQVQSVTEGKEALGSALVRLRNNGRLYSGNGISTDIVAASIRAYINALNKIVFEEE